MNDKLITEKYLKLQIELQQKFKLFINKLLRDINKINIKYNIEYILIKSNNLNIDYDLSEENFIISDDELNNESNQDIINKYNLNEVYNTFLKIKKIKFIIYPNNIEYDNSINNYILINYNHFNKIIQYYNSNFKTYYSKKLNKRILKYYALIDFEPSLNNIEYLNQQIIYFTKIFKIFNPHV